MKHCQILSRNTSLSWFYEQGKLSIPIESYQEEEFIYIKKGGDRGAMVIVVAYGQIDASSNPGRDSFHFT